MKEFMKILRKRVAVALIGGSDFPKLEEQMGGDNGKLQEPRGSLIKLKFKLKCLDEVNKIMLQM